MGLFFASNRAAIVAGRGRLLKRVRLEDLQAVAAEGT